MRFPEEGWIPTLAFLLAGAQPAIGGMLGGLIGASAAEETEER